MTEWLEKEVCSVNESDVEELQSCKCPHCGKILTTPYIFTDYPYCPSCGEPIKGKKKTQGEKATPLTATQEIIKESGLSRAEVARRSGITADTVQSYYNMRYYPNIANFVDICKACGVTVTIKNGEVYINETD